MWTANEIRKKFIQFFVKKYGHTFVPSSPVVPADDPTLLFTNAGMNQFKDVFLGTGTRSYRRAVNSQKCIRAGGKHNDLDDVGKDTYHHTFFEMLGNWSFGDYFKKEAIAWAWELLTEVWGLDKERLHATVFAGDQPENLQPDDEAFELWKTQTDIHPSHIHRGSKKDNFWEMGETGPCGPCSEIHYDRTPDKSGGKLVNVGRPEVIEIWNLVFIQFNRGEDRKLTPLPARNVDTGMGFERITAVLQGKDSNYDTDVFKPIMDAIGQLTGRTYCGKLDDMTDTAFRVVADHLRMLTFAITDGALPSNKGRGSVLRSVLRRAVRFGWQYFDKREPFIYQLVPVLVEHMGGAYPELKNKPERVADVIRGEEADFLRTLDRGIELFSRFTDIVRSVASGTYPTEKGGGAGLSAEEYRKRVVSSSDAELCRKAGLGVFPGEAVFKLYTEAGFPPDLTRQMAEEQGLKIDMQRHEELMRDHEEKSRAKGLPVEGQPFQHFPIAGQPFQEFPIAGQPYQTSGADNWRATDDHPKWTASRCDAVIVGFAPEKQMPVYSSSTSEGEKNIPGDQKVGLLLDQTCFYIESGGQVGDRGLISTGTGKFEVSQVTKVGNSILHIGQVSAGRIELGQQAQVEVNPEREFTRKNHTATHLLHWALQKVLGEHVEQAGSKVKPDEFTFDFTHTGPMSADEKAEVERLVNERIYQDLPVQWRELPIEEAKKLPGVRHFFGDKYGDVVRVVEIGDGFSREFCGGTHLDHTGQAGFFKIVSEEGIAKGIRRLTCVTAREAVAAVQKEDAILANLTERFRCKPEELPARVETLQEEIKKLQQQLRKGAATDLQGAADKLLASAAEVNGAKVIVGEMPTGPEEQMRQQVDRLRQKAASAVVVVGWADDGKVQLLAAVTEDLVKKGLHAGKLVGQVAKVVGGGGGGKPTMAQAGGKEPAKLPEALELAKNLAAEQLSK
jgi:alanyl-tRNA synthetase